jgi:(p)ppGpp synthase/HD superfamily hydrolase
MKETMNLRKNAGLERAIEIAVSAHRGQVDKAGAPYILHPLRVMLSLSTKEERIVGVLHDLVEDCEGWTFEKLSEVGFSAEIIDALKSVTKYDAIKNPVLLNRPSNNADETYEEFVRRAAANRIGAKVKRADLIDNMDWSRITEPTAKDLERMIRYKKALAYLDDQANQSQK